MGAYSDILTDDDARIRSISGTLIDDEAAPKATVSRERASSALNGSVSESLSSSSSMLSGSALESILGERAAAQAAKLPFGARRRLEEAASQADASSQEDVDALRQALDNALNSSDDASKRRALDVVRSAIAKGVITVKAVNRAMSAADMTSEGGAATFEEEAQDKLLLAAQREAQALAGKAGRTAASGARKAGSAAVNGILSMFSHERTVDMVRKRSVSGVIAAAKDNFKAARTARKAARAGSFGLVRGSSSAKMRWVLPAMGGFLAFVVVFFLFGWLIMEASSARDLSDLSASERQLAQFLFDKGLDDVHVAAVMANIRYENGGEPGDELNPGSIEDGGQGGGHGICQWTGVRWNGYSDAGVHVTDDNLLDFAASKGKPWYDLDVQIEFFWHEFDSDWNRPPYRTSGGFENPSPPPGTLVSGSRAAFDSTGDVAEATRQFCYGFEGAGFPRINLRIDHANTYLSMFRSGGGAIGAWENPCPGSTVSSEFGYRTFDNSFHKGIDLGAAEGTPYYAVDAGTVLYATNDGGYNGGAGNWVVIDHGGGIVTKYMHSSRTYVSPGDKVSAGQHIGDVGNTGASFGAHLHFQIEVDGAAVDPRNYIDF